MHDEKCQIMSLPNLTEKPTFLQIVWQKKIKPLKWTLGRRIIFLRSWIMEVTGEKEEHPKSSKEQSIFLTLKPGDLVKVKSDKEIRKTLDRRNKLKGCGIMDGMWKYCGTEQRVLKVVRQFLDERDYLMKKCKGIVILDEVICEGTIWWGKCDRSCYYFWREEWLEKVDSE